MFTNESEAYAESEAYDSASVVPIHTRSELSSDSDSVYDSASVASVASVNQPLRFITLCYALRFTVLASHLFTKNAFQSPPSSSSFTVLALSKYKHRN